MGKMREHLFLKLRPIPSGNHGHFDDVEKVVQEGLTFWHPERIYYRQAYRRDQKQSAFSFSSCQRDFINSPSAAAAAC